MTKSKFPRPSVCVCVRVSVCVCVRVCARACVRADLLGCADALFVLLGQVGAAQALLAVLPVAAEDLSLQSAAHRLRPARPAEGERSTAFLKYI